MNRFTLLLLSGLFILISSSLSAQYVFKERFKNATEKPPKNVFEKPSAVCIYTLRTKSPRYNVAGTSFDSLSAQFHKRMKGTGIDPRFYFEGDPFFKNDYALEELKAKMDTEGIGQTIVVDLQFDALKDNPQPYFLIYVLEYTGDELIFKTDKNVYYVRKTPYSTFEMCIDYFLSDLDRLKKVERKDISLSSTPSLIHPPSAKSKKTHYGFPKDVKMILAYREEKKPIPHNAVDSKQDVKTVKKLHEYNANIDKVNAELDERLRSSGLEFDIIDKTEDFKEYGEGVYILRKYIDSYSKSVVNENFADGSIYEGNVNNKSGKGQVSFVYYYLRKVHSKSEYFENYGVYKDQVPSMEAMLKAVFEQQTK
jgi:hypothetical protein